MINMRMVASSSTTSTVSPEPSPSPIEGRRLQAVLGEAMRAYLAQKLQQTPRRNVLEAFRESLQERDQLYR
jgi:hypothetical protein